MRELKKRIVLCKRVVGTKSISKIDFKYRGEDVLYRDFVNVLTENEDVVGVCRKFYEKAKEQIQGNIYKYYSLNGDFKLNSQKLECLEKKKIYTSCRAEFNDPYDDKGYIYIRNIVEKCAKYHGMKWQLEDIYPDFKRFCCFTKSGNNNMSMWAHYANNHQGYCVEYAEENNRKLYAMLLPVEYVEQKIDLTDMICSRLEMVRNQSEPKLLEDALEWCSIFLTCIKHKSWESEKELRFCCPSNYPNMPHIKAIPSKIYIGSMCSKEYEDRLNQIGESLSIHVYKMELDIQESKYTLSPKKL